MIAIAMGRYIRRLTEASYAYVEEASISDEFAEDIDWSAVGAAAANRALAAYGVTTVAAVVDADLIQALEAGDDPPVD